MRVRYVGPGMFSSLLGRFNSGDELEVEDGAGAYALGAYPDWFVEVGGAPAAKLEAVAPAESPAPGPAGTARKPFRPNRKG